MFYLPLLSFIQQLSLLNKKVTEHRSGVSTPAVTSNKYNERYYAEKTKKRNMLTEDYKKIMNKKYEAMAFYVRGEKTKKQKSEFRSGYRDEENYERSTNDNRRAKDAGKWDNVDVNKIVDKQFILTKILQKKSFYNPKEQIKKSRLLKKNKNRKSWKTVNAVPSEYETSKYREMGKYNKNDDF